MKLELELVGLRETEERNIIEANLIGNDGYVEIKTSYRKTDPIEGAFEMFVDRLNEAIQAQTEANEMFLADGNMP